MVNHPNRSRRGYRVTWDKHWALFSDAHEAQMFAQYVSMRQCTGADVDMAVGRNRDLIGQYDSSGYPTPEFRGRGDECYPAGLRARQ